MANKIVVLDGYVANQGDLEWNELAALGDLTVYDRTPADQVVERAKDAFAIFTNKVVIDNEILEQLPSLRFIGVLATGYNNVDVMAARRHGVVVSNVPAYSTHSVVQNIWAHLLNITNEVALHSRSVKKGGWVHCLDFSYRLTRIIELTGLTMGIYGLGAIGSEVAKIANAFGMKVIAFTSKVPWQLPGYIRPVEKDELFMQSDVLCICSTLTSENHYFVNAQTLKLMKPTAILLNAARGGLVDSQALADAMRDGTIYAAGIDVMEHEPPAMDDPLLTEDKCCITPHIAWQSDVARKELLASSARNLSAFIDGNPINVVN